MGDDARKAVGLAPEVVLTVIIVSWRVPELLRECLSSLRRGTSLPQESVEVIVVDNDSRDGTVDMVRSEFPHVLVVANAENVGFGRANNQGFALARGRFLCLLNPDTVVPESALDECVDHLVRNPGVGIVGPRLLNGDGSLQRWTGGAFPDLWNVACHHLLLGYMLPPFLRSRPLYVDRDDGSTLDVDWVCGACMVLRPEPLGGALFDERFFMYGEDMELCYRMKRAGYSVAYLASVSIVHFQGASMRRQTAGAILESSLKGPQQFYAMIEPARVKRRLFDSLVVAGFFLRWSLYRIAFIATRRPRLGEKGEACARYLAISLKLWRNPAA